MLQNSPLAKSCQLSYHLNNPTIFSHSVVKVSVTKTFGYHGNSPPPAADPVYAGLSMITSLPGCNIILLAVKLYGVLPYECTLTFSVRSPANSEYCTALLGDFL